MTWPKLPSILVFIPTQAPGVNYSWFGYVGVLCEQE